MTKTWKIKNFVIIIPFFNLYFEFYNSFWVCNEMLFLWWKSNLFCALIFFKIWRKPMVAIKLRKYLFCLRLYFGSRILTVSNSRFKHLNATLFVPIFNLVLFTFLFFYLSPYKTMKLFCSTGFYSSLDICLFKMWIVQQRAESILNEMQILPKS